MADYDIFRDQLAIKYPSYGHALWVPSPRNPDRPVQVGDVGFIRRGKFYRLFNSLLPADDPSHEELGVPEYYEPLLPNVLDHIDKGSLSSNNYCSAGVNVESDPGHYSSGPDVFRQVSFQYQRTRGAAVLSLPVAARREDTLAQGDFGHWMVQHIDSWFAFARKLGLGIQQMEEIVFVTGCDRTRSWTNIAFLGGQVDAQVSFGVNVEGPASDISINFQLSPELVRGAVISQGPEGTNLPENQCVFIRGFRVARSFWKLPKRLKAAAGPSPDSEGYDRDADTEVISIPAITKYRDPLHLLLDCIAEEASDCEIVLAHDDDLAMISGLGHDSPLETLEPDVMMDLLRRSTEIRKVLCDLSPTDRSPNTDTSVVKVAMLPVTSQNWTRTLTLLFSAQHLDGAYTTLAGHADSAPSTLQDLASSTLHSPKTRKTSASNEEKAEHAPFLFGEWDNKEWEPDNEEWGLGNKEWELGKGDGLLSRNQNSIAEDRKKLYGWTKEADDSTATVSTATGDSRSRSSTPPLAKATAQVSLSGDLEKRGGSGSENVTIKVRWRNSPLGTGYRGGDVWTFVMKRHDNFDAIFEQIADKTHISSLLLVLMSNGSRVFASATPSDLKMLAEAQMVACDRGTYKYMLELTSRARARESSRAKDSARTRRARPTRDESA